MTEDLLDRLFGELATAQLPVPGHPGVIARGRQRRRRTRGAAVCAAVVVAALGGAAARQLADLGTVRQAPAAQPDHAARVCQAAPDRSLTAALQRTLPLAGQVLALSPDGRAAYAAVDTSRFDGIVEENAATGAVIADIAALPASGEPTAGTLTGNGDLIWFTGNTTPTGATAGGTPMRLWSASTGAVTTLEPPGQRGVALSDPVLAQPGGTVAAWVQADGSRRAIVEANLSTGTTAVVATGYVGPPLFVGSSLVWAVADTARGLPKRLVARNAAAFPARQQTAVPPVLRGVSPTLLSGGWGSSLAWPGQTAVSLISSYGGTTAYFSASLTELFYSAAPSQPARMVLRLSGGNSFSPNSLALGAGYLGWGTASAASYLASTRSLAAAAITNGSTVYGTVDESGDYVIVTSTRTPKRGAGAVAAVSESVVAGLRCQPTAQTGG
jgi:hypothetical protein